MIPAEHQDRLIDLLLDEQLRRRPPTDLRSKVLAAIEKEPIRRPSKNARWVGMAAAAAAAIIVAIGGWWIAKSRYPQPSVLGDFTVAEGGTPRRGATIVVGKKPARIDLGHYVHLDAAADSRLRIDGENGKESVYLESGQVESEVDRGQGEFSVQTECGTVTVTGTRFLVRIVENQGDEIVNAKSCYVKVLAGTVLLSGLWGTTPLAAGGEAKMPPVKLKVDNPNEVQIRGKMQEGPEGWSVVDSKKRSTLIMPKGAYPKNFRGFRLGVDFIVTLRDGKLVSAHSLGGEPKK